MACNRVCKIKTSNQRQNDLNRPAFFMHFSPFFTHTFCMNFFTQRYKKKSTCLIFVATIVLGVILISIFSVNKVNAMPFYDLKPQELVLRSSFYTTYSNSSEERKCNVKIASKSIDNTLVDIGGEFSFNKTVGARTVNKGYKNAKIIVNGEFVDGIGGGVCQVSTTLYNAILLAGLEIIEYHPHSLPVSYVAPSFDAMVNSGSADLRFINNTHNPIIIKTYADGNVLKIEVYGEPMKEKLVRQSRIVEEIPAPPEQVLYDEKGEYPELYEGQKMVVKYGKPGYKSEGYLIVSKNEKIVKVKKIRTDKYNAMQGVIVYGSAISEKETEQNASENQE